MDNINAGMLHRAFSVFLFTPDGKLVLQQVRGLSFFRPLPCWSGLYSFVFTHAARWNKNNVPIYLGKYVLQVRLFKA